MSGGFPPISNFKGIARDLTVTTQGRGCLPESRPGGFGSEGPAAMAEVGQILEKTKINILYVLQGDRR